MTNDKTAHILARLEIGFRTDAVRLKALEQALAVTLADARHFGRRHGSPDEWNSTWNTQWDQVEGIVRRINDRVRELEGSMEGSDPGRLAKALAAWETIQSEDARMVDALGGLRAQAMGLNVAVEADWNRLARALATHLETIHACAQALRIKLELLQRHSPEEVDQIVRDVLAKLPNRARTEGPGGGLDEQPYREAATELVREKHKFLGFVDVLKGLSMWVESTEERADKNLLPGGGKA
jgi:hypothetical protein